MGLRTFSTKQQTSGGSTDTVTIPNVRGKIRVIKVLVSASSDFHIHELQGDGSSTMQDILGTSGSKVTVAADKIFNVRTLEDKDSDGSALTTYTEFTVDGSIKIDVASLAENDTWTVDILVEETGA